MIRNVFPPLCRHRLGEYHRYWDGLTVTSNADYFRRWLFAFCSVHTTWEGNVAGYQALRDLAWLGDDGELRRRLCFARCGMHNNRARFITEFSEDFWAQPAGYSKLTLEPWWAFRDRLEAKILGLGLAKTSFALEMIYPTAAEVACLDVHMLRLYTDNPLSITPRKYREYEADWLGRSEAIGHPPYVARMAWWDAQQGKENSRYWSHCLE